VTKASPARGVRRQVPKIIEHACQHLPISGLAAPSRTRSMQVGRATHRLRAARAPPRTLDTPSETRGEDNGVAAAPRATPTLRNDMLNARLDN